MTQLSTPSSPADAGSRAPNYWLGFLLNLFCGGGGFAFIGSVWKTVVVVIVGNLLVGPFARLAWGAGADRWGFPLFLILSVVLMVAYRNEYHGKKLAGTLSANLPPLFMRLIGVWLSLLTSGVIRLGYVQGWLPLPGQ